MKRIYLLEVFFSFDGIEYSYRFPRIYSSVKEMKNNIEYWENTHKYTIVSKTEEEAIYVTEIGSFYKLRTTTPIVNSNIL